MYVPRQFEETRPEVLHRLIASHPFATLVTHAASELVVNHIPFLIDPGSGPYGTLRGHVAKANPVWRNLSDTVESIAVFQGPESYISPSWYPAKYQHGKVVPTWNYAIVHVHGFARAIDDTDWLLELVNELTDSHEASRPVPWKVSDAPADFIGQMLNAIVGIEIPITKIVGKWKVSQNRSKPDRLGVVAGLQSLANETSQAMAELVTEYIDR